MEVLQKQVNEKDLAISKLNQDVQTKDRTIKDIQAQLQIISSARDDANALKQMQASFITQIDQLEGQLNQQKAQNAKDKADQKQLSEQMIKDLKQDVEELKHKQRSEINILKSQAEHEVQKGLANTLKIEGQLKQAQSENKLLQEEMASLQRKFQEEYQSGIG